MVDNVPFLSLPVQVYDSLYAKTCDNTDECNLVQCGSHIHVPAVSIKLIYKY